MNVLVFLLAKATLMAAPLPGSGAGDHIAPQEAEQTQQEKAWALYSKKFASGAACEELAASITGDFPGSDLAKDVAWHEACRRMGQQKAVLLFLVSCLQGQNKKLEAAQRWRTAGDQEREQAARIEDLSKRIAIKMEEPWASWKAQEAEVLLLHKPLGVIELDQPGEARMLYLVHLGNGEIEAAHEEMTDGAAFEDTVRAMTRQAIEEMWIATQWNRISTVYSYYYNPPSKENGIISVIRTFGVKVSNSSEETEKTSQLLRAALTAFIEKSTKYDEGHLEAQRLMEGLQR